MNNIVLWPIDDYGETLWTDQANPHSDPTPLTELDLDHFEHQFTDGDCLELADAIAALTGWPVWHINYRHAAVTPDNGATFLDITGWTRRDRLEHRWPAYGTPATKPVTRRSRWSPIFDLLDTPALTAIAAKTITDHSPPAQSGR